MGSVEYEYWTKDTSGRGFCSVTSIEDALVGHFHDMNVRVDPLGPIVEVYVLKKSTVVKETVVSLNDVPVYTNFNRAKLEQMLDEE